MTVKEFKERLFDVINESDEILIRDVEFVDDGRNISVMVEDGSKFIVQCRMEEKISRGNKYMGYNKK